MHMCAQYYGVKYWSSVRPPVACPLFHRCWCLVVVIHHHPATHTPTHLLCPLFSSTQATEVLLRRLRDSSCTGVGNDVGSGGGSGSGEGLSAGAGGGAGGAPPPPGRPATPDCFSPHELAALVEVRPCSSIQPPFSLWLFGVPDLGYRLRYNHVAKAQEVMASVSRLGSGRGKDHGFGLDSAWHLLVLSHPRIISRGPRSAPIRPRKSSAVSGRIVLYRSLNAAALAALPHCTSAPYPNQNPWYTIISYHII